MCSGRPFPRGDRADDGAASEPKKSRRTRFDGRCVCRCRPTPLAIVVGDARRGPCERVRNVSLAQACGEGMNVSLGTYLNLAWTFGIMSLFAVGGANATIPEMHRVAVEVNHWMTDAQFADMF